MKKSLKSVGLKLAGAALYACFYWFFLKDNLFGAFRFFAIIPSLFLCLLAFGELLLTFIYQVTGLQKKIDETAAPPVGSSVGGIATHFMGEFGKSSDSALKGDHKDSFFRNDK